jgi:hypothetical protein
MAECMFIWPIQAWLLSQGTASPLLWGFETLTGGWFRLLNFFVSSALRSVLVFTIDWSGFDRYARHTVIDDIHEKILLPMFTFSNGYHPTYDFPRTTADPQRLHNLWSWMTDSIKSTPLMTPDGTLLRFLHSGIYSGYLQTQLLDSIYNLVMIYTILFRLGFAEHQIVGKVQGDDSIFLLLCVFLLVSSWLLNMISFYAKFYFGAILSEAKSEVREGLDQAEVLKYRNRSGIPYRDPLVLLAQIRFPERSYALETLKARAIGIAYANCGSDPRVYRICEKIFVELETRGVKVHPAALPDQMKFIKDFLGFELPDLNVFPSYYDTIKHLVDQPHEMPSNVYWPRSHFIGLPGA